MNQLSRGLYGGNFDRQVERYDESAVSKLQERYWRAKQTVIRKLKRKEDDCIVASDSELDSKLELFKAIEQTNYHLLCILDAYQDRLYTLAHEENSTGRFLKDAGKHDKTRAGKMMAASGKTMSYAAQQRIQLQQPLSRLYQEVETFQFRAISDTYQTIDKMENARTAYRAALLWMKDISQQLDPDTYKQLDKFRKVQGHVRRTKAKFDKLKLDTLQKIDMLSASRCNMLSNSLVNYQNSWLVFWEKTSRTMSAVAESFKGYQYYEFNLLKNLTETSKRLAISSAGDEGAAASPPKDAAEDYHSIFGDDEQDKDKLIFFDADYHDDDEDVSKQLEEMGNQRRTKKKPDQTGKKKESNGSDHASKLIDVGNPSSDQAAAIANNSFTDMLTAFDKEEAALFNEIFSLTEAEPTPPGSLLSKPTSAASSEPESLISLAAADNGNAGKSFLPSQLLEQAFSQMSIAKGFPSSMLRAQPANPSPSAASNKPGLAPPSSVKKMEKDQKSSATNWFNLFAELDPLSDPDSIAGQKGAESNRNAC